MWSGREQGKGWWQGGGGGQWTGHKARASPGTVRSSHGSAGPGRGASQARPPQWAQNFHCFLSISRLGFLLGPVEESADEFRPWEARGPRTTQAL